MRGYVNQQRPNMRTRAKPHQLVVRTISARSTRGALEFGWQRFPCALGRTGSRVSKREGDGASPVGAWPVREAFYRADRLTRPRCGVPLKRIGPNDGWCDGPSDRAYNRHVRHPYRASAEHLFRADGLYDVIVVLGYNDRPAIKGRGSAIFLHCARPDYAPTQGCIAIAPPPPPPPP
jgi:L,D-peptidoglycan transpeptidase YkuD (ErfK/YbiS/YcfS/YnhG family)